MADYHIEGTQTVASPDDTTLTVAVTSGNARCKVFDFTSGFQLASPSDNLLTVTAQRHTADGTGTSVTPRPLDPADAASLVTALHNHTIEPTYTSDEEVWGPVGQHMRATYRWVAAPGKELIVPSNVDGAGIGWFATHASVTPEHYMSVYFAE